MRLKISEFAETEPQHLAEIIWWQVIPDTVGARTCKRRAIFYLDRVPWGEHPWGEGSDRKGGDFVNEWTLETKWPGQEWTADGRTAEGWPSLQRQPEDFDTLQDAARRILEVCETERAHHEKALSVLRDLESQAYEVLT